MIEETRAALTPEEKEKIKEALLAYVFYVLKGNTGKEDGDIFLAALNMLLTGF